MVLVKEEKGWRKRNTYWVKGEGRRQGLPSETRQKWKEIEEVDGSVRTHQTSLLMFISVQCMLSARTGLAATQSFLHVGFTKHRSQSSARLEEKKSAKRFVFVHSGLCHVNTKEYVSLLYPSAHDWLSKGPGDQSASSGPRKRARVNTDLESRIRASSLTSPHPFSLQRFLWWIVYHQFHLFLDFSLCGAFVLTWTVLHIFCLEVLLCWRGHALHKTTKGTSVLTRAQLFWEVPSWQPYLLFSLFTSEDLCDWLLRF